MRPGFLSRWARILQFHWVPLMIVVECVFSRCPYSDLRPAKSFYRQRDALFRERSLAMVSGLAGRHIHFFEFSPPLCQFIL